MRAPPTPLTPVRVARARARAQRRIAETHTLNARITQMRQLQQEALAYVPSGKGRQMLWMESLKSSKPSSMSIRGVDPGGGDFSDGAAVASSPGGPPPQSPAAAPAGPMADGGAGGNAMGGMMHLVSGEHGAYLTTHVPFVATPPTTPGGPPLAHSPRRSAQQLSARAASGGSRGRPGSSPAGAGAAAARTAQRAPPSQFYS